jgi:hypothetical protein
MKLDRSHGARILATVIALTAWVGVAVQFHASSALDGPPLVTLWSMARYFTILTNLALAVIFTSVALDRPGSGHPSLLGGVTLAILLVGIVFSLLLSGVVVLRGADERLSNFLMHYATPILTPLFWLGYAPKGALSRRDPLIWAVYPLSYLAYVLLRGAWDGRYPYGFIDVGKIGWMQVSINAAAISAGFLLAGEVMLWLDRRLARQGARHPARRRLR